MRNRTSFIKLIQLWGIIFLIGIGVSIIAIDVIGTYRDFSFRADQMRTNYIARQKRIIKEEVNRVVNLISYEKAQSGILTREKIKSRVYEAYYIAQNIYQQNKTAKSKAEIQQIIIDTLRPIRFEQENGYYFITRLDGIEILFADKPEMEGLNLLDVQDTQGQYVVKDMIEIAEQTGEGFYEYHWTKPDAEGNDFKKISFIKLFEPYDWLIGTGLYVVDVEDQIKVDLLSVISRIRFGKEGYIFINRLNGDTLVSNGKLFSGTKKLWEVFNKNPEKMKDIFDKEYNAALKPEGDYIYYSHIKLTSPNKESPKASFIYGIPDLLWLVGAGVYLDDVETDIALLQTELDNQIKAKMLYSIPIVIGIVALFFLLFNWLNRGLKNDFNLFFSFFNRAAHSNEKIDREAVKFVELDRMAEYANKMLEDRKQTEEALQESEEKYRYLIEELDDIIWTLDLDLRTTYVSPSIKKKLGFTPKERMAQAPGEQMTSSSQAHITELFIKELNREQKIGPDSDRRIRVEVEYYHRNGSTLWFENIVSALRDENGVISGIHGVSRDISERKRAEVELVESEQKFSKIFQSSPVGMVITSFSDGKILDVNVSFTRITGYSPKETIGRTPIEAGIWIKPGDLEKGIQKLQNNGSFSDLEFTFRNKDGAICLGSFSSEIINIKGEQCIITVIEDITEQKRFEAQLQQAQKMKAIGTLAGGIAHDFNNLLMGIQGHTSLMLAEANTGSEHIEHLKGLEDYVKNATDLTKQLLGFASGGKYEIKPTGLNNLIKKQNYMFGRMKKEITIRGKYEKDLWTVKVDKGQIEQVLLNIYINAWQAMPGGGNLYLQTENITLDADYLKLFDVKPGKYVKISVTDTGVGMDEATQQRIFDPFFTTKEMGRGVGLGLASVYGIIKNHGGFINLYSEKGEGTTFNIHLPASEEEIIKEQTIRPEIQYGSGTILLVDDEEMITDVGKQMLQKLGYDVIVARGGNEALSLYQKNQDKIDVVILDMIMPDIGGGETYNRLEEINPDIKVILSSGYSLNGKATEILERGCNGFIQKPFNMEGLSQKVSEVLDKG